MNEAHCKGKIVWSLPVTGGSRKEEGNKSERINGEDTGKDCWNLTTSLEPSRNVEQWILLGIFEGDPS